MSSDVSTSPPSFHKSYKTHRGRTKETARHHRHGKTPSTSHILRRNKKGDDQSSNGVEGAASISAVAPQHPGLTKAAKHAQLWNAGGTHPNVPSTADIQISNMVLPLDSNRTRRNVTGAEGGEGRANPRRGDRTRYTGSGNNGLDVDRKGHANGGSLVGGKEPPIRGYRGLTTATFLKLVRRRFGRFPVMRSLIQTVRVIVLLMMLM